MKLSERFGRWLERALIPWVMSKARRDPYIGWQDYQELQQQADKLRAEIALATQPTNENKEQ